MARTVVDPIQVSEQLQPAANPVDTYVRPADPVPSPLHELASALSNFGHDVSGAFANLQQQGDQQDDIRGKAAAYKASGLDYAEAVKRGDIPAYASPEFVKAYKNGQGEILGKELASNFTTQYQAWGGRNSQDPADFDNFLGDFIKKNLNTDDPDVLKGAMPYVSGLTDQAYTINNTDRNNAIKSSALDTSMANANLNIENADNLGIASGKGTDYDTLWAGLMDNRQKSLDAGFTADEYDKSFVDTVENAALDHQDPAILALLDRKVPGETYNFSDDPSVKDSYDKTKATLLTAGAERTRLTAEAQKAADAKQKNTNTAWVIGQLTKDPAAKFDDDWLDKASALDPTLRDDIVGWRKNAASGEPEDQPSLLHIQAGIMDGDYGVGDLMNDMRDGGNIHSTETASKMLDLINSVGDAKMKPLLSNDGYTQGLKQIEGMFPADANTDPGQMNTPMVAMRLDYQKSMLSWFQQHQDAGYGDILQQSYTVLKQLSSGVAPNATTGAEEYHTPQEPGADATAVDANGRPAPDTGLSDNPLVDPQQEEANKANAQPVEDHLDPWREAAPPKFNDLTPDQQKRIQQEADARGLSTQDYIAMLYHNLQQVDPGKKTVDGQLVTAQKDPDAKKTFGGVSVTVHGGANTDLPAPAPLQAPATGAHPPEPGTPDNDFNTTLDASDEADYEKWKAKYAPNDDGADYDFRGAYAAGVTPDAKTGHWPDTFKKPNEPTFSDQSQYAQYAPDEAGTWNGDTYVPNPNSTVPHNPDDETDAQPTQQQQDKALSGPAQNWDVSTWSDAQREQYWAAHKDAPFGEKNLQDYIDGHQNSGDWQWEASPAGAATAPAATAAAPLDYAPDSSVTPPGVAAIDKATADDPMKVWGGDAPPSYDALNDDQKATITEEAGEKNMSTGDYIDNLYYRLKADQQGVNMTTPQAAGATPLATLVGKTEGTTKGRGYNEVIGYGKYESAADRALNISEMPIGDVKKLQNRLIDGGAPSGAVGKYQIINRTLIGLQKALNLPDNAIFTPQVQDEMFVELLRERGLDRWKAGHMTDNAFANSIANEWASLPGADGKSVYGQGVGATRAEVLAALNSMRAA